MRDFYDLVIVGSGVAGLSALMACPAAQNVAVLSPGTPLTHGSSWRAQGGVAVALHPEDSPRLHAEDTLKASRWLADRAAVRVLTEEGPERVAELLQDGLPCDRNEQGEPAFGLEAAHSRHRVIHQQDHTGKALIAHLWEQARQRPRTDFLPLRATRLLTGTLGIEGVLLSDGTQLRTPRVILASGGFAGLYLSTTTGLEVRGEGLVLASDAGARLADMEFVQFHPTALAAENVKKGPLPLLTEALRGAGALLRTEDGERFVHELLPRDEVARAIASQRREGRTVYLDLEPVERLEQRFPGAASHLARYPDTPNWLPVRPAAHYTIGGVVTDLDGATSVPGLYACGEVASVGIHGANRLASNSLLEGLVFGHRAALHAATTIRFSAPRRAAGIAPLRRLENDQFHHFRARFEDACGVVRSGPELQRFLTWLEEQPGTVETTLARFVAQGALRRGDSLGAHFRSDAVAAAAAS